VSENVELLKRGYEAFNRGDLDRGHDELLALLRDQPEPERALEAAGLPARISATLRLRFCAE
jgi:hypothetical protein